MKTILVTAALMLFASTAFSGIKEKKWQKENEAEVKKTEAEIKKNCGCSIPLKVTWSSSNIKENSNDPKSCASEVSDAFKAICREYKSELCSGVKSVTIKEGKKHTHSLKNGVFAMTWHPGEMIRCNDDGNMKKTLEDNL